MEQCAYTREQIETIQNMDIRSAAPAGLRNIRGMTVTHSVQARAHILLYAVIPKGGKG